jgi:hypothetical protein
MKITFQIVHNSENIDDAIFNAIKTAYENLYSEKSDEELKSLYEVKYNVPLRNSKSIAGFEIEVEEIPTENYDSFLGYFTDIKEDEHICALLKFHDETRFETYLNYYKEIAELEMQLREILSYIFYYEYSEDYYNLLGECEVKIPKDIPQQEELQKRLENQFFYLTFNSYLSLDRLKEIKVDYINSMLKDSDSYEDFRDKICNRGIKNEKHMEFLADIKENLQTIESVRNSVAHNRTISDNKLVHYDIARKRLLERFQEFWVELLGEK